MSELEDPSHLRSPRIRELEGLRGCLAWWVVLYHVYFEAGLTISSLRPYEYWVGQGWTAVPLFIILSGYVITLLIETQREPYGIFIVRRFFRIAPLYYLVCALGAVQAIRDGMPREILLRHILAHLTMLHGLIPDEVLTDSAHALSHVSWSISVEWQFYLLAPAILLLVRRSASLAALLLFGCYVASKLSSRWLVYPESATVMMRAGLFAIGIASFHLTRLVVRHADLARSLVPYLLPIAVAIAWVDYATPFSALPIWMYVFASVLSQIAGVESFLTRPIRVLLGSPFIVWLGQLSYSTYLCHHIGFAIVKFALGSAFLAMAPRSRLPTLIVVSFPIILGLSFGLYHLVERPGMWAGKVATRWMGRRTTATPPEVRPLGTPEPAPVGD